MPNKLTSLNSIEIFINGRYHCIKQSDTDLHFNPEDLQDILEDAITQVHAAIKAEDFSRNDGKRIGVCPVCKNKTEEAGKVDLPPYRDWQCALCSMNGYDGRFQLKG